MNDSGAVEDAHATHPPDSEAVHAGKGKEDGSMKEGGEEGGSGGGEKARLGQGGREAEPGREGVGNRESEKEKATEEEGGKQRMDEMMPACTRLRRRAFIRIFNRFERNVKRKTVYLRKRELECKKNKNKLEEKHNEQDATKAA